ncbi:MAG: hypothetical protein RLZZ299_831 [Pseudomonadota bacterium]
MLETLSRGFKNARLSLQGKAELDETNVADALKDVRTSLLEADVDVDVARAFLDRVKAAVLGKVVKIEVPAGMKVTPADYFVKACYDELETLLGGAETELSFDGAPTVVMMVGLQGSGKTTTAGKLARLLQKQGQKPMLVACDIYRPAAIDQLSTLGRKLSVPVFTIAGMDPVQLATLAVSQARNVGRDVVILDTAGRLAIDETLMAELERIKAAVNPQHTVFVCDAMIGQSAAHTAAAFDARIPLTGFVLTKLDGDARGGAALSIRQVTGKPVLYVGMGEGLDKLEAFRPAGLAQRILGFGDVVGLMKDFEQVVDKEKAEKDAERMLQGTFTFDDFQGQLKMIRSMGSLRDLMGKLPFMEDMMAQLPKEALDDYELVKVESMIQSMTAQERRLPDLLDDSRMRRIARGSGRTQQEVRDLVARFKMTRTMMKDMGGLMGMMGNPAAMQRKLAQLGGGRMPGMPGMPGMMGGTPGAARAVSKEEMDLRRKKAKDARKARKKQRR